MNPHKNMLSALMILEGAWCDANSVFCCTHMLLCTKMYLARTGAQDCGQGGERKR